MLKIQRESPYISSSNLIYADSWGVVVLYSETSVILATAVWSQHNTDDTAVNWR